jgi:hypothetical protein
VFGSPLEAVGSAGAAGGRKDYCWPVRETVGLRRRGTALLEVEGERLLLWSGLFVDPKREADGSAERGEGRH